MKIPESRFDVNLDWRLENAFMEGLIIGVFKNEIAAFEAQCPDKRIEIDGRKLYIEGATREELMVFIKIFGGTWKKEVEGYAPDKIRYSREIENPYYPNYRFKLEASDCPPPPSCVIEEVEELVPASVRKVRKMRCTPPEADDVPVETQPTEESE